MMRWLTTEQDIKLLHDESASDGIVDIVTVVVASDSKAAPAESRCRMRLASVGMMMADYRKVLG